MVLTLKPSHVRVWDLDSYNIIPTRQYLMNRPNTQQGDKEE